MISSRLAFLTILASTIAIAGCETMPTAEPTIQMGSNAETTIDGLHRVDNGDWK